MNVMITILAALFGLLLLLLLLALVLPRHYSVTVSEIINRPKRQVYGYVSLLYNQVHYSEWLNADPGLFPEIIGTDGTVGAILKWESKNENPKKNVGMGEQEIKRLDEDDIEVELRLMKPMPATCKLLHTILAQEKNKTKYTCTFYAYAKFPVNLPSYIFGRSFISKKQQQTLQAIKHLIEEGEVKA